MTKIVNAAIVALAFSPIAFGGWFDDPSYLEIKGIWGKEPLDMAHRGMTIGKTWAAQPCTTAIKASKESCLGKLVAEYRTDFIMEAFNLPDIGVVEVIPTTVHLDNVGAVLGLTTYFEWIDFAKLEGPLVEKYGTPQITQTDDTTIMGGEVNASFYELVNNRLKLPALHVVGNGKPMRNTEDRPTFRIWVGKNYAILLERFWWDIPAITTTQHPQREKSSVKFDRTTGSLGSLRVIKLPTYEERLAALRTDSDTKTKKKLQEWKLNPNALKSNL
jgi:hypothetical protein